MIFYRKAFTCIALLITGLTAIHAQQGDTRAVRLYETWVSVNNETGEFRGVLYKINDSSLVIADSRIMDDYLAGNVNLTEIPAGHIDFVKARMLKAVKTGAITGSVSGLAAPVGLGIALEMAGAGGLGMLSAIAVIPGAMAAGALLGVLVTAPNQHKTYINRDLNDYIMYRDKLKRYSFVDRYYTEGNLVAYNPYAEFSRNRAYFNLTIGAAIPSGRFPSEYLNMPNRDNLHAGSNITLSAGYMLTRRFSISISNVDYEYFFGDENISIDWGTGGFMANAGYSIPAGDRSILNIRSGAGPIWSFIDDDEESDKEGAGAGINAAVSYGYVLSGRWCLTAEAGYFLSFQNFEGTDYVLHAVTAGIGIQYRFLRK